MRKLAKHETERAAHTRIGKSSIAKNKTSSQLSDNVTACSWQYSLAGLSKALGQIGARARDGTDSPRKSRRVVAAVADAWLRGWKHVHHYCRDLLSLCTRTRA